MIFKIVCNQLLHKKGSAFSQLDKGGHMTDTTWTWMMYLATHNNVAAAGLHSLGLVERGIEREQPGGPVRVLVQQATPTESVRSIFGATPETVANLGQVD